MKRLYAEFPQIVALDGEVSNSTYAEILRDAHPERFFEMYIAEQNMVGAALGLQARGKLVFASTFAAFFSRAYDQIRMTRYSDPNLKFCGSHAGVSIGEDGPSQMGLEDLAMFRAILGSVVLYPCDAVSTERLVEAMARQQGIAYLRTSRLPTPILYGPGETFAIGGLCPSTVKNLRIAQSNQYDILILDEFIHCIVKGYVAKEDVIRFLKNKPLGLEIVMTGRNAPDWLIDIADLVTEMKCIKHPMEQGIPARVGIES